MYRLILPVAGRVVLAAAACRLPPARGFFPAPTAARLRRTVLRETPNSRDTAETFPEYLLNAPRISNLCAASASDVFDIKSPILLAHGLRAVACCSLR